jgi:malonyl CoA-acyl carrier protein transacylase
MAARDAILFAGQGSTTIFDQGLSDDLAKFVTSSPKASAFLADCLGALRSEIQSLQDQPDVPLRDALLANFPTPLSLAHPSTVLKADPIVQSISLYIHQMLEYMHYASIKQNQGVEMAEATGFCSGMIAAVVASSSPLRLDSRFFVFAVEAFRLAFWVGLRVAQRSGTQGHTQPEDAPWSLVVSGCDLAEITELISAYNEAKVSSDP